MKIVIAPQAFKGSLDAPEVAEAIARGVRQIFPAAALGMRFLDADGRELPLGGGALGRLKTVDASGLDPRLHDVEVHVACDVNNPLTGPTGASHVYGPQKGADPEMVKDLDTALGH